MHDIASWIAPIATVLAAIVTAANLGSRATGWGFVIFTIGSVTWCSVAIGTHQPNLLWTNGFLTLVNLAGVWRWLGRQARHEDGAKTASARSAAANVPSLVGIASLIGGSLVGRNGTPLGEIVDGMMRCDGGGLAYLVVSEGGLGGAGERLHAIDADRLQFADGVTCDLGLDELAQLPTLADNAWPAALSRAAPN